MYVICLPIIKIMETILLSDGCTLWEIFLWGLLKDRLKTWAALSSPLPHLSLMTNQTSVLSYLLQKMFYKLDFLLKIQCILNDTVSCPENAFHPSPIPDYLVLGGIMALEHSFGRLGRIFWWEPHGLKYVGLLHCGLQKNPK